MYVHASLGAEYVLVGKATTKAKRVQTLLVINYRLFVSLVSPWLFGAVEFSPRLVIQEELHHLVVCFVNWRNVALEIDVCLTFDA